MSATRGPTQEFLHAPLDLFPVPVGTRYERVFHARHPDPLGYGKDRSRFSDPRRIIDANRFGVLYLGSSVKVCVIETLIRDVRDNLVPPFPMSEAELSFRNCATIEFAVSARLIDLRGDGPLRMGIPSDVAGSSRHVLARKWSLAFHEHPADIDGIIYPSRLNGESNIALYDRAIPKVGPAMIRPLIDAPELAAVLDDLQIALIA